ncbi:MAG: glycoside hydrolase [Chloroflexi bacterium]|nr:glycoside hydrolase [Chloroflexota bacterium]
MIKKKFLKTKCKVTFILPDAMAADAETVYLVGDFNDWDETATAMEKKEKKRSGTSFEVTIDLELDKEYEFRYRVNGSEWHNDWHADRYVPNPFSGDNSVVSTHQPSEA